MKSFLTKIFEPISILLISIKFLLICVASLIIFAAYLLFTEHGLHTAFHLLPYFTPYEITFSNIQGTFLRPIAFTDFHLKGPRYDITADTLAVNCDWPSLWDRRLHFKSLSAKKVKLNTDATPQFASLEAAIEKISQLPFSESLHLEEATIATPNHQHTIHQLAIARHSPSSKIESIHYVGTFGQFNAYFDENLKCDWQLHFDKNPYLATYFTKQVTTKGTITLLQHKIDNPKNIVDIQLQANSFTFENKNLKDVSLSLKGTLQQHKLLLKGVLDKSPLLLQLTGQVGQQKWQGKIVNLRYKEADWKKLGVSNDILLHWGPDRLHTTLDVALINNNHLHLKSQINTRRPYHLTGEIQAKCDNIRTLSSFLPVLQNVKGKANATIALAGTLFHPFYQGNINVQQAKIKMPNTSHLATIDNFSIKLLESNQLRLQGNGHLTKGEFSITGTGVLSAHPQLSLQVQGSKLLVSDTLEYTLLASPDLTFTLQEDKAFLHGKIFIPEAKIQNLKSSEMISPSEDVVILSKKKVKSNMEIANVPFKTDVEIILSNKVTYKGHGFNTQVSGNLQITQQPGQPPLAKGKLILDNGKYRAYGKTFNITYGQLLFSGGPLYDPILDIRAERSIHPAGLQASATPIQAGMKFLGHVKSPKIEFYSTPSMSDADIISYLIVGRPQHEVNQAQAELLFEAVSQLAGIVGHRSDVQFDLAERLKLDQFGFSKKSTGMTKGNNPLADTVFIMGKQLSDRLYLHYSMGLMNSASQLGIKYSLHKNVTLEAQTGMEASSADILFSFEGH